MTLIRTLVIMTNSRVTASKNKSDWFRIMPGFHWAGWILWCVWCTYLVDTRTTRSKRKGQYLRLLYYQWFTFIRLLSVRLFNLSINFIASLFTSHFVVLGVNDWYKCGFSRITWFIFWKIHSAYLWDVLLTYCHK